jgi:hypothetical protein
MRYGNQISAERERGAGAFTCAGIRVDDRGSASKESPGRSLYSSSRRFIQSSI